MFGQYQKALTDSDGLAELEILYWILTYKILTKRIILVTLVKLRYCTGFLLIKFQIKKYSLIIDFFTTIKLN